MSDSLQTVIREGTAFNQRHPELNSNQQVYGGWTWGLLRAIAECPNCPGHYRVPQDQEWNVLYCPNCGTYWEKPS